MANEPLFTLEGEPEQMPGLLGEHSIDLVTAAAAPGNRGPQTQLLLGAGTDLQSTTENLQVLWRFLLPGVHAQPCPRAVSTRQEPAFPGGSPCPLRGKHTRHIQKRERGRATWFQHITTRPTHCPVPKLAARAPLTLSPGRRTPTLSWRTTPLSQAAAHPSPLPQLPLPGGHLPSDGSSAALCHNHGVLSTRPGKTLTGLHHCPAHHPESAPILPDSDSPP